MKLYEKGLTELATGSVWVFFGLITGRMLEYINRIIIARSYGPSDYGIICLGLTISVLTASLALLGLNVGATRYVAIYSAQKDLFRIKGLIYAGLKIVFPASLILALFLLLSRDFLMAEFFKKTLPPSIIMPFILIVPCMAIAEFSYSCLRGLKLAKYAAISKEMLGRIVTFLCLMIAILLGAELMGVAFAYLMGFVSYTAFTLFWLRKSLRGDDTATMSGNVGNFEARELVLFSLPLLFAFILSHIGIELHTILLGYFKNTAEVGLYSAALPFSQFISLPLTILLFMFLPVASQHWYGRNIEELQSVFKFVCRWIFIVSCSIFLALTLFSREIITVTFGSSFSPAHRALIILSVGYFFNALCGPTGALLLAAGESKKYLLGDLIGVGGALFLCLYLIPKMGVTGAAYAGMGQLLIVNIIRVIFIYQKAKIIPFSFRPFAGLLLMVGIVVVLKDVIYINNFVVKMVVFLGLYSIAIATTKAFRREDISFLSNLLIKRAPGKRLLCQGKTN